MNEKIKEIRKTIRDSEYCMNDATKETIYKLCDVIELYGLTLLDITNEIEIIKDKYAWSGRKTIYTDAAYKAQASLKLGDKILGEL